MAKKIIINTDMVKQTKSHIVNLFKPIINPFTDRDVSVGGLGTNNFALQYYPGPKTKGLTGPALASATSNNPIGTMYNNRNIITNLFLCTQDFITFMDKINNAWEADIKPRVLTPFSYVAGTATGFVTVSASTINPDPKTLLLPIISGPSGNKASLLNAYETFAEKGLWGTGSSTTYGVGSSSIQEMFLRYLYSIDQEKRNVAFEIAKVYYNISSSEATAANKGFIPAIDFDSSALNVTENSDEITLEYNKPIEFFPHYDETIHNPLLKKLYLYFPYITINAQRPGANRSDKDNSGDGYISLYTGVKPSYFGASTPPVVTNDPSNVFENNSFCWIKPQTTGANPAYGDYTANPNMPVLTNSIWSATNSKWVNQAGYTAINISETGDGGDITFDHTDKIDFMDSLKFVIKAPTVFS